MGRRGYRRLVYTRPGDLRDEQVAAALMAGWGISADVIEHAAVGFGSHHWRVAADGRTWFLSVDDLEARCRSAAESRRDAGDRLTAALTTAAVLQGCGLDFVIAPERTITGSLLQPIDDTYVLATYRHVDGRSFEFGQYDTSDQRTAVVALLARVHEHTDVVRDVAVDDDFLVPGRDQLDETLGDDVRWGPGPFAAEARSLLIEHADPLLAALRHHDALAERVRERRRSFVITHGEPHRANTIDTDAGPVLIDWDTALLAPAERDLWMLLAEDPVVADHYTSLTGRPVDVDAIELFTLWWDLCEVSSYVADLRRPHADTADTAVAWDQLQVHLDPTRWRGR